MRSFGQFCRQIAFMSVLVLALACPTFAGVMQFPGDTVSSSPTTNGEIPYPGATVDSVTEIALSLLQGAVSLI
jgi:hypothetical protein